MDNFKPTPQPTSQAQSPAPEPTTNGTVEYPAELYSSAWIENEHRDFNDRLMEARAPKEVAHVTPKVPEAVARATELEMAAGALRVAEFEKQEKDRKAISQRTPEKWEGKNTPVFRPGDFSEYRPTLKTPGQTVSKDAGLRAGAR